MRGWTRLWQPNCKQRRTRNAAASAEEASGANAPTDAPSETADEYARLDAREAELLAEAEGHPPAEVEEVKKQPKPPPTAKAGGVRLVPGRRSRSVKKIHLKPRADAMRSNPPLGRTAYPRRRPG